jgi:D-alanine-D-alanine ligase-like ATP-grasp enzyme
MNSTLSKSSSKGNLKTKKFKPSHYYLRIFSRHPSTKAIREVIMIKGKKAVYRHGSTTEGNFEYELNSVDSVKISSNKHSMKVAFDEAEVRHAPWIAMDKFTKEKPKFDAFIKDSKLSDKENRFLIIKHKHGSRGTGNYLIKSTSDLDNFIKQHKDSLSNYIIEQYKNFTVEYRLHVSELGCFYTCRKVLKSDTPKEKRFQRHDDNCSWFLEKNPKFDKPSNWDEIVKDCQKALRAIGADILAFDVKCTSTKEKKDKKCDWILIESCSAPAFGNVMAEAYKEHLPKLIANKYE